MKQLVIIERQWRFTPEQIVEVEDDYDVQLIHVSNEPKHVKPGVRYIFKTFE